MACQPLDDGELPNKENKKSRKQTYLLTMKMRRRKLLVEPPQSAASDIAFILIIFFLVCASVQPDNGRPQEIPRSENTENKQDQSKNIEVALTRDTVLINGAPQKLDEFAAKIKGLLAAKSKASDKVVLVKSRQDTPYFFWVQVTEMIDEAGGVVTLQIEEEQTVIR